MLSFLVGSEQAAWSQQNAQAVNSNDVLLAKCTKLLNYGEQQHFHKPSKLDAVSALGLLGDERAVPVLIDHLENEENNNLRLQIVKTLGWIGSTNAMPALEKALQDKYPFVRQQAATVLKEITGKDYEYDKTGVPDPADFVKHMQEYQKKLVRSAVQTNNSSEAIENTPSTSPTNAIINVSPSR